MSKAKCTAIVLAAGQGKRMNSEVPKLYIELQNKPVIYYTLRAFQESACIGRVVLVVESGQVERVKTELVKHYGFSKVTDIIEGGKERYDSVWCGLQHVQEDSYVFIHDGARAFVTEEIIKRAYENVIKYKACVVGMPVKDTIKIADKDSIVSDTPNRSQMWQVQTPQAFEVSLIVEAYREFMDNSCKIEMNNVTDDSMLVERLGKCKVKLVEGSYNNIKITTAEDIALAEAILKKMY